MELSNTEALVLIGEITVQKRVLEIQNRSYENRILELESKLMKGEENGKNGIEGEGDSEIV